MQVSIWEKQSFFGAKDVVIVGAGLAGLWSALELHKRNPALKILIVERGAVPQGASTRNAGFACFGSPTELLSDAAVMGEDTMWQVVEMRYRGIEKIRNTFGDGVIEFDSCGGYELLDAAEIPVAFDEKLQWLNTGLEKITGLQNTFIRHDEYVNQFNFNGFNAAVENKCEGGIHSGKLVQALTRAVLNAGIEILYSSTVIEWVTNDNSIKIKMGDGIEITCHKLLFCTNAFTPSLVPGTDIKPGRGQVLLTSPIHNLPFSGTFHYQQGFYYFRNLGNRVLLGGARNKAFEEETTTVMETTGGIQQELERFLRERILPGRAFTIEQRWSGIMGFTTDHLPSVKTIQPNVYMLMTCNGMGVAISPIMAEKAADLVLAI